MSLISAPTAQVLYYMLCVSKIPKICYTSTDQAHMCYTHIDIDRVYCVAPAKICAYYLVWGLE